MANPRDLWALELFEQRLDAWIELEKPSDDLRFIVLEWVLGRAEHPYKGVTRQSGFPNLWFGAIPDTQHGNGDVVTCAYWINEEQHSVRCDSFATLGWPV